MSKANEPFGEQIVNSKSEATGSAPAALCSAILCALFLTSCAKAPDNTIRDAIPALGMRDPKILMLEQEGDWGYLVAVDQPSGDVVAFGTLCVVKREGRTYWTHDKIVVLRREPANIGIETKLGTRHYSVSTRSSLPYAIRKKWEEKLMEYVDTEGLDKLFPRHLFED